jgi:hypothetical protein
VPERELAKTAAQLTESVKTLTEAVGKLMDRTERSEKAILRTVALLILDVVLTIAVGASIYAQFATNARVEQAIRQQDVTTTQVLCPLYAAFLGSYNPQSRAPGSDRDIYEQNFVVIRDGYRILGCNTPFVPPPTRAPTTPSR